MELERRAALASRIERARQKERENIRESFEQANRAIGECAAAEQAQRRTAEWMNAESAAWREHQLRPLAMATDQRVVEARSEFLERRKERRQVESVIDSERVRLGIERERRIQRELDDWFGTKRTRQRSKSKQPPLDSSEF